MTYPELFLRGTREYAAYLWGELTFSHTWKPWYENYLLLLIGVSAVVAALELATPWRREQRFLRRDFWLDGFYLFFNFFLFSLVGYNGLSMVGVQLFQDLLAAVGVENLVAIRIAGWPAWAQWLTLFLVVDFVSWWTHRLLHRVPWLWRIHQVHHSVREMGFSAHLRYHWLENVIYKAAQYLPVAMIGFGVEDFFVVHLVSLTLGHLNHANLGWDYGPLRYLLNQPRMHIWHHALDAGPHPHGANFGISLSVWDYLFGTAWVPSDGRDLPLGYPGVEEMPAGFLGQSLSPFLPRRGP